ncbi:MAG: type transport system permease protein, partial [Actinomycetota bacterium]|nr:type transport system permease protein [Actinomycetota bacterium]
TKFWSVRTTWWSLIVATGLMVCYAVVGGLSVAYEEEPGLSAPGIVVGGTFYLSQFAVIALSTLFLTSEYASGSIRASLQWVPVRNRLLLAKGAVLVPILFMLGVLVAGVGLLVAGLAMQGQGDPASASGAVTATLGLGVYFALLGLLCLGVGTALRSTAGSIVVIFVLLLMLPMVVASMGSEALVNYFPGFAGINAMLMPGDLNPIFGGTLPYTPWLGALICAAWSAVALLIGSQVLRKRDA